MHLLNQRVRVHRPAWDGDFSYRTERLLGAWQSLATHESWESLVAEPELTSSRRATDNLVLASLELINVPSREDNLVLKEFSFGGDNPDEEVGGKRDWERVIIS
jgi:hypothetical protein